MIINNFNVWQPPVAKHWPITPIPPTTTIPPPSHRRRPRRPPCKCPNGPSEGVFVNTNRHATAAANATSPPSPTARHVTAVANHRRQPRTQHHHRRRAPPHTTTNDPHMPRHPAKRPRQRHVTAPDDHRMPCHCLNSSLSPPRGI